MGVNPNSKLPDSPLKWAEIPGCARLLILRQKKNIMEKTEESSLSYDDTVTQWPTNKGTSNEHTKMNT